MAQDNGKLNWSSLIIGTLLLIIAVVIFSNPVQNFYTLTWLIGLLIMIGGVIQLLFRRTAKKLVGVNTKLILINGIIDLIFGILVVFNVGASSVFFVFIQFGYRSVYHITTTSITRFINYYKYSRHYFRDYLII